MSRRTSRPGYGRVPAPGDPRLSEAWALIEAARRLNSAILLGDGPALRDVILLNWRLWTLFQATAGVARGGLPSRLRANLLQLARFVERESEALLAFPDPFHVQPLVDINLALANGLHLAADRPYPAGGAKQLRFNKKV